MRSSTTPRRDATNSSDSGKTKCATSRIWSVSKSRSAARPSGPRRSSTASTRPCRSASRTCASSEDSTRSSRRSSPKSSPTAALAARWARTARSLPRTSCSSTSMSWTSADQALRPGSKPRRRMTTRSTVPRARSHPSCATGLAPPRRPPRCSASSRASTRSSSAHVSGGPSRSTSRRSSSRSRMTFASCRTSSRSTTPAHRPPRWPPSGTSRRHRAPSFGRSSSRDGSRCICAE
mmetsp:Transcript_24250/g.59860  ORF Transcript_24250/g.59860 Transcript_24250/m.59860 type:complete len:235 (-) Transcript_24250:12043-12747(-)